MILPVQITFRNMEHSEAVEARVREEVAKLETFYDKIMGCRVVISIPHKHHRKGALYHVSIDLTVPGAELVVKQEPSLYAALRQEDAEEEAKSSEAHPEHKDAFVVIRDAFKEARRQLQDHVRRERGQTKLHQPTPRGRVIKLFPDEGYGFIEHPDGGEVYFHSNSVLDNGFDRLTVGAVVSFTEERGESGVQASTVRQVA
jgi:cold shock CspA family protein/ribosome-associated translation inhibitor RaiA